MAVEHIISSSVPRPNLPIFKVLSFGYIDDEILWSLAMDMAMQLAIPFYMPKTSLSGWGSRDDEQRKSPAWTAWSGLGDKNGTTIQLTSINERSSAPYGPSIKCNIHHTNNGFKTV